MKAIAEIIQDSLDDDEVLQLDTAIEAMTDELGASSVHINPQMSISAFIQATEEQIVYLGDLVLSIADQVNALPQGIEAERVTLGAFLKFTQVKALYEQVQAVIDAQSSLQVVTGEVPDIDSLRVGDE